MFKPEIIFSTALATSLFLAAAGGRAMSGEYDNTQRRNLINRFHGTTCCAPNVHQRVSVDLNGLVTTKQGKDI